MNKKNRVNVKTYIEENDLGALLFGSNMYGNYYDGVNDKKERIKRLKLFEKNAKKLSYLKLVTEIISLARWFGTCYANDKEYQCSAGRRRTAIDIWNIARGYGSKITIFGVMHTLYKISKSSDYLIVISWCTVILRRTFREETMHTLYNASVIDEFGLTFSAWQYI